MTDEEKEAIEEIEYNILNDPLTTFNQDTSFVDIQIKATAIETILKGFKKQQKEIETLKNTELDYTTIYMSGVYDGEKKYKDKIRGKIKDLEDIIEWEKPTYKETLEYTIDILYELLEER